MNEKRRLQRVITNYDKQLDAHRQRVEAAKKQLEPYLSKVQAYEKGPQAT